MEQLKNQDSFKLITLVLSFVKDHVTIAALCILAIIAFYDGAVSRLFNDGPSLVATSSLRSMELGPISINKYKEITDNFDSDAIVERLKIWNENSDKPLSVIPGKEALEAFKRFTDFYLPEGDVIRNYGNADRYQIKIRNIGNQIAEDIFLTSSTTATSAIIERATNAGIGEPKYEIIEHNGREASLGVLRPNQTMEINIWHEYYVQPSALTLTSADGVVNIQQEVISTSRNEILLVLLIFGITLLFLDTLFRGTANYIITYFKKAWHKHKLKSDDEVEPTVTSEQQ